MINKILIATNNQGKAKEFKAMFEPRGFEVQTLADFPDLPEVEETGTSFEENALLKAKTISDITGEIVLADDSGLCIKALNGEPGIYSARYAGEPSDDDKNIDKVLDKMTNVPDEEREAYFNCTLALVSPHHEDLIVNGHLQGLILHERLGHQGFGYDPIFYLPEQEKGLAELSAAEKNAISHRAIALEKLDKIWDEWYQTEVE